MIDLVHAAQDVQSILLSFKWKFCFIGGLAVQQWGEPRLTRDVDLTLITGFGDEEKYVNDLLKHYEPRIDEAKQFALKNRVLLLQTKDGIGIDISLGGISFEELVVQRAKSIEVLPAVRLRICSPEDLVVLKAFASREIDWMDVRGIVTRQGSAGLDWKYMEEHLRTLADLKGEPSLLTKLQSYR